MANERDDELTPEERRAIADLPDPLNPPVGLEAKLARELHARGLLRPSTVLGTGGVAAAPVSRWRMLVTAAAVLIAFAGGWVAQSLTTTGAMTADSKPRYMLLLYGAGSTPDEEPHRVTEYTAWAGSIASRGDRVSGEKLEDRAILLGAPPGAHLDPAELGGFFIVSAPDDASAEELARTHPHLKYGGRVVIRPIATLR